MTIKYSKFVYHTICIMILANLSILKIIPVFTEPVVHYGTFILCLFLFLVDFFIHGVNKYYKTYIMYLLIFLLAEIMYTVIKYDYSFANTFRSLYFYIYLLLAPTIFNLIKTNRKYLKKIIHFIVVTTIISLLMRIALSVVWTSTGQFIFSDMAYEFSDGTWIRNGALRVIFPCFAFYLIPLFLFDNVENVRRNSIKWFRFFWLFLSVGGYIYYTVFVIQSRSFLIYSIIVAVVLVMMKKGSSIKKLLVAIVIILGLYFFISSEYFSLIYYSLFHSGGAMGTSLFDRMETLTFFRDSSDFNFLFGIGFLSDIDLQRQFMYGHISDIGYFGNLFRTGLIGLFLYVIIIGRWIYCATSKHIANKNEKDLIIGCVISCLLFGINTDCFYAAVIFSIPFISAICESILLKNKETIYR